MDTESFKGLKENYTFLHPSMLFEIAFFVYGAIKSSLGNIKKIVHKVLNSRTEQKTYFAPQMTANILSTL